MHADNVSVINTEESRNSRLDNPAELLQKTDIKINFCKEGIAEEVLAAGQRAGGATLRLLSSRFGDEEVKDEIRNLIAQLKRRIGRGR